MQEIEKDKDKKKYDLVDSTMDLLFSKLDEAIGDMENGRLLTEDELWLEMDSF